MSAAASKARDSALPASIARISAMTTIAVPVAPATDSTTTSHRAPNGSDPEQFSTVATTKKPLNPSGFFAFLRLRKTVQFL
jgi:hypothetical protein